ncbi:hypothetical protein IHE45_10G017600 [Dioscorea alata]|uniref:Uncharacterized protein n=1 Tax=Dioscorea alata TaxID=55571 RepID=A0ACB7V9E4_DIOAL|nr:hypothetical protein IHE45_10G017600 [Dioscorea alata]
MRRTGASQMERLMMEIQQSSNIRYKLKQHNVIQWM